MPGAAVDALQRRSVPSSLALIGHEPNLSSLAALLLVGSEGAVQLELKKGAVTFVEIQADLPPGSGVLRWSASPKILRLLDPTA